MRVLQNAELASSLTYEQWQQICMVQETAGLADMLEKFRSLGLAAPVVALIKDFRKQIEKLADQMRLDWKVVAEAFASRPVYALLKAVGFSVKVLVKGIEMFAHLYKMGILTTFQALAKSKLIDKVRRGVVSIDALLSQYPLLKMLAGPAVIGFVVWCWLHANFTGHPGLDLDFSNLLHEVVHGSWTFEEILLSPAGLLSLATLFAGLTGIPLITPIWLAGGAVKSLFVALMYTGLKTVKKQIPPTKMLAT